MGATLTIIGYLNGYAIPPNYSNVSITSTGAVGGAGLSDGYGAPGAYVTVNNQGRIFTTGSYYSVALNDGGQLINGSTENTTSGVTGGWGVRILGTGVVANFSTIIADGRGVSLPDGGTVTNGAATDTVALIRGAVNGVLIGTTGVVTNFGAILATGNVSTDFGVEIYEGGSLVNGTGLDTGAVIEGYTGFYSKSAVTTITNFALIRGEGAKGFGVDLAAGGSVVNGSGADTSALIEGASGIDIATAAGTVTNFGSIRGTSGNGVRLEMGGSLANGGGADRSALIEGDQGVTVLAGTATIANSGTIQGTGGKYYYGVNGIGMRLTNGSKTNATALIEGYGGVEGEASSTIVNFGSIIAVGDTFGAGVYFNGNGVRLTNGDAGHHGALITGYVGMKVNGTATVTNYGSIVGQAGVALDFLFGGDTLQVEAGCVFQGAVIGGGGTLDLASGTGSVTGMLTTGTVTVSGSMATTAFTKFNTLEVGAGASFAIAGSASLAANQRLFSAGALTVTGAVANAGLMETLGKGVLTVKGAVSGAGSVKINGGVADFVSTFNQNVTFVGATGILELGKSQTYLGTVTGLSKTGTNSLDLVDIAFGATTKATFAGTSTSGTLTVTDGTHTAKIKLAGNYVGATFTPSSDGHGGTKVIDPTKLVALPPNPTAPVHRFIEAAGWFGVAAGGPIQSASYAWRGPQAALSAPRTQIA
jgi:hypothetical protein